MSCAGEYGYNQEEKEEILANAAAKLRKLITIISGSFAPTASRALHDNVVHEYMRRKAGPKNKRG